MSSYANEMRSKADRNISALIMIYAIVSWVVGMYVVGRFLLVGLFDLIRRIVA